MNLANKMDRVIEIQRAIETRNAIGEVTQSFSTLYSVPAAIKQISGSERIRAGQTMPEIDLIVNTRYISDVVPSDRFVYNNRTYDIQAVNEIGRRAGLEIIGKAVVPDND